MTAIKLQGFTAELHQKANSKRTVGRGWGGGNVAQQWKSLLITTESCCWGFPLLVTLYLRDLFWVADQDNLCVLLFFTAWLVPHLSQHVKLDYNLQSMGSCCQAPRRITSIIHVTSTAAFRRPWAPFSGARRCAWCSSSCSRAQPTTVSVSWENWAWWNSETWVAPNFGSLEFRNVAQLCIFKNHEIFPGHLSASNMIECHLFKATSVFCFFLKLHCDSDSCALTESL